MVSKRMVIRENRDVTVGEYSRAVFSESFFKNKGPESPRNRHGGSAKGSKGEKKPVEPVTQSVPEKTVKKTIGGEGQKGRKNQNQNTRLAYT